MALGPAQAAALGALQGATELLPVSSSGHLALAGWLTGCGYADLEPAARKQLEVALHAGAAAALMGARGRQQRSRPPRLRPRAAALIGLASIPVGLVGYALQRPIEERLGTPTTVTAGLTIGGLAMALADRRAQARRFEQLGARDALWLGLAQAAALIPGVSRSGAVLAAARWRRFTRPDAARLERALAAPVVAMAALRKARTLAMERPTAVGAKALAAGIGAAFASTLLFDRLLASGRGRPLAPFALYRIALALAVWAQPRRQAARIPAA